MKFRKKPIIIEAFRFRIDNYPDWFSDRVANLDVVTYENYAQIPTLEGMMFARRGDWIIKGVSDEIYPCKPDIFEKTYEHVDE